MKLIDENKQRLNAICEQHSVAKLYLFGSILTNKFNAKSDIDMLIQFASIDVKDYFDNYMNFKESLEKLFNREIDLIENQAIKNPIFRKIVDREKQLIYG
jgi:uncharacterized protein